MLELMRRGEVVGRAVLAGLRVHLCREPAVRVAEAAQRLWRAVWRAESDLRARAGRPPACRWRLRAAAARLLMGPADPRQLYESQLSDVETTEERELASASRDEGPCARRRTKGLHALLSTARLSSSVTGSQSDHVRDALHGRAHDAAS